MDKKAQVTIFVILAIVLVGIIALFFAFKDKLFRDNILEEFQPIYDVYSNCINQDALNGVSLLSAQGGRIDTGDFEPGNDFSPFSSQLSFFGVDVPYWYGLSGNNIITENVPTKSDMERELSAYITDSLSECDFSSFEEQGFIIERSQPTASVDIQDREVLVSVDADISVFREDKSAVKNTHKVVVTSNLGSLYKSALQIYNFEKETVFLENYALDVLQTYAPVDGVEVQCNPKIWKTPEVVDELQTALALNIAAIRFAGPFSGNNDKNSIYFTADENIAHPVSLIYLPNQFPSKIEITPATQALMLAEPVGTQEGLGILGFCYVPYHFVYDVAFPVMFVVGDGIETFQFPFVIIIDNNLPRDSEISELVSEDDSVDICSFKEGEISVNTYDADLNPIPANVSYNCFDSLCNLGETKLSGTSSTLNTKIPVCVNGRLIARASGYADKEIIFSSNKESVADLILDREHLNTVLVKVGKKSLQNITAVMHFKGEGDYSKSVVIPESNTISLKEGLYDISVYVYGNSNVVIPATRKTECFKTAKSGIFGIFGSTKEECVDVEIPAVKIDYALRGGGKTTSYIIENELKTGKINVDVSELPKPTSLEQLQYNYEVFDTLGVQLSYG
jgi:hypothetical protein